MNKNINRKALKSGIWYTISNFLVKGIGFITTPIFTRLLTKQEFGMFNNFTSWVNIFTIFVTLNLESTLISARYDYEDNFDEYILSMLSLSTIVTVIWWGLLNLNISFVIAITQIDKLYINIIFLYLLFLPAISMFQARERYVFEYKKSVILSSILVIGTSIVSVILVYYLPNKLFGRIVGFISFTVILGIVTYLFFILKAKKVHLAYWRYALPIALPYIPHLLAGILLNSMDRVMIEKWCGSEATALYSLAYSCGTIVLLLINSVNSAFVPWLGQKLTEKKYKEILLFSRKYIVVFLMLAIGIMLIAPEILLLLGGKTYTDSKYVITPVAMGCICQFLYTLFSNVEQFLKKTGGMAVATVSAALINFILNCLFIPRIGYLAAAYTTLIGYLCLLLIHMFYVRKLKLDYIYDYKLVLCVVLVGMMITCMITYSYTNIAVRVLLIFVYCVVIFTSAILNRKKLYKEVKHYFKRGENNE